VRESVPLCGREALSYSKSPERTRLHGPRGQGVGRDPDRHSLVRMCRPLVEGFVDHFDGKLADPLSWSVHDTLSAYRQRPDNALVACALLRFRKISDKFFLQSCQGVRLRSCTNLESTR